MYYRLFIHCFYLPQNHFNLYSKKGLSYCLTIWEISNHHPDRGIHLEYFYSLKNTQNTMLTILCNKKLVKLAIALMKVLIQHKYNCVKLHQSNNKSYTSWIFTTISTVSHQFQAQLTCFSSIFKLKLLSNHGIVMIQT